MLNTCLFEGETFKTDQRFSSYFRVLLKQKSLFIEQKKPLRTAHTNKAPHPKILSETLFSDASTARHSYRAVSIKNLSDCLRNSQQEQLTHNARAHTTRSAAENGNKWRSNGDFMASTREPPSLWKEQPETNFSEHRPKNAKRKNKKTPNST